MVNWSNYFLSLFILLLLGSCQPKPALYEKEIAEADYPALSEQLMGGRHFYYQGAVGHTLVMQEAMRYDPSSPIPHRELGAPTVKRGMAKDFYRHYQNAVTRDPVEWQGWRGYLYLYFYRDYERALADFQALDTLTPNFVDYPQATSVLFMSGICYLQMGQYEEAIRFFDLHIAEELKTVEESYIGTETFLFKGIARAKLEDWAGAKATFERGLRNAEGKSADLWFWLSQAAAELGDTTQAREALENALLQFDQGYYHDRPYVEEFYQTYREQLVEFGKGL